MHDTYELQNRKIVKGLLDLLCHGYSVTMHVHPVLSDSSVGKVLLCSEAE